MDPITATLHEAIRRANELREGHNGVGGVYLYLGHDGGNVCELKDSDAKQVGLGVSSRSLLEAVDRAYADFRTRTVAGEVKREPYRSPESLDRPDAPKREAPRAPAACGLVGAARPPRRVLVVVQAAHADGEAGIQEKVKRWLAGETPALVLGADDAVEVFHVPG